MRRDGCGWIDQSWGGAMTRAISDDSWLSSEPIKRPRISDEVTRRLASAISRGHYRPGDFLPSERELMRRFGVGRPAVREALFSLRKLGLIAVQSGSRSQVVEPDGGAIISELSGIVQHLLAHEAGVRRMQHVRALFETALARDAALFGSVENIADIKRALVRNREALGHRARLIDADIGFHFAIAKRTGNPLIMQIHDAMAAWLRDQRVSTLTIPGVAEVSLAEHEAIYEAIAAHDANRAEFLMRDHLNLVANNYWMARHRHR